ncbi:hypothetical protein Tco_0065313, partial [Tanacetum coccineum]
KGKVFLEELPLYSQPQRKQKSRKSKKKNTKVPQPSGSTDNVPDENVPTTSNDPLLTGKDRLKLTKLTELCTNLQNKVLDLEKAETAQDSEIASLKKKVKKLERRNKSRTPGLKRLRKVGSARRVESSNEASLGDQEDAAKQGMKIADIDADAEVTLIDETQGRNDDNLMFDTSVLDKQEIEVEKTLIEIKAAKPKVKGVMIKEPSEFTTTTTTTTPAASKPSQDKDKAKMIKSEKPLKKKDQIIQKEEEANIALIESWDNIQAMMDADYQMAQQLQAEEQEQLSIEEKLKLFVQLLEAKKKHFVEMKAREKRNKPPTQAQQRKLYSFKRVNTFVDYKTELVEGSEKRAYDSTKRAGTELDQEVDKKQKIDDSKVDDDQEEARMKELLNIVSDEEEVEINAIPLATKPPSFIHMLRNFDKEDLETLWKLVKAKHGSTRPWEGYERVLWGDLMTMFEPDVESLVAIYAYLYAGREKLQGFVNPNTIKSVRIILRLKVWKWEQTWIPCKYVVPACWNIDLNRRDLTTPDLGPKKKRKTSKLEVEPFVKDGGNNAEASGNASRQAQQAEHVVGLDGSGGLGVGKVPNAYGSGVGVVIGLSVIGRKCGHVGVSVGSQSCTPSRWKKRYKHKDLVHKKTLTQLASQPLTHSQVQVTQTRNADGREMGDGILTQ